MKQIIFGSCLLLFFFLCGNTANAFYCIEPSEPYCVRSYGTFDSEYEFKSCKREVEYYLEELQDYAMCIAEEAEDKQKEVIDNFNRKVQRTNDGY